MPKPTKRRFARWLRRLTLPTEPPDHAGDTGERFRSRVVENTSNGGQCGKRGATGAREKILLTRRQHPTRKQHLVGRVIHADVLGILSLLVGLKVCESSTRSV